MKGTEIKRRGRGGGGRGTVYYASYITSYRVYMQNQTTNKKGAAATIFGACGSNQRSAIMGLVDWFDVTEVWAPFSVLSRTAITQFNDYIECVVG